MNAIKDILREELEYALDLKEFYEENIRELPKGSISKKIINNRHYLYLQYRTGAKVNGNSLSRLTDNEIKEIEEKIEKRKKYIRLLREVNEKIIYLKKALNVKV